MTELSVGETPQKKKRMRRPLFIAIFEIAMIGGCIVAMFTVPRSTSLRTFLFICVGVIIAGNLMLFHNLKKPVDPTRKINYTKLYLGLALVLIYWTWTLWSK